MPIGFLEPFLCRSIFPGPDHLDITKFSCIWFKGGKASEQFKDSRDINHSEKSEKSLIHL